MRICEKNTVEFECDVFEVEKENVTLRFFVDYATVDYCPNWDDVEVENLEYSVSELDFDANVIKEESHSHRFFDLVCEKLKNQAKKLWIEKGVTEYAY